MNLFIFQALSEPNRCKILEMLATKGHLSATEIADRLRIHKPTVSTHLKVLQEAELVMVEAIPPQRIYYLNPAALESVAKWVTKISTGWAKQAPNTTEFLKAERLKARARLRLKIKSGKY